MLTFSRLAAEAMLGPDGKRCKRCNPVVVDLVDEDEELRRPSDSDVEGDRVELVS